MSSTYPTKEELNSLYQEIKMMCLKKDIQIFTVSALRKKPCYKNKCKGEYYTITVGYANLRLVNKEGYKISVTTYKTLSEADKKQYNRIVSTICDTCGDNLDKRTSSYIHENF